MGRPRRDWRPMMAKGKRGKGKAAKERSYSRLTRHERNSIERMLDRGMGCREIARELGRAPSTVANEVARHRFVTAPMARRGEPAPEGLGESCPRLGSWPRCCNGCKRRRAYGCNRTPRVFYGARMAQAAADAELSEARRGIDEDEASVAMKLSVIRSDLARGLSPEQISRLRGEGLGLSRSTIYRWVGAGYAGMTNMELRRKVGYRPRRRAAPRRATRHDPRRGHDAFLALGEDRCAAAWEMDTVMGSREDSACLLTLLHRPSRFQLALPLAERTCAEVVRAIRMVRGVVGGPGMEALFGAGVLTDNGPEFADEGAVAAALGERPGETRLYYCDPRQSQQKGACERNHVEVRKLLPKGRGIRFDLLTRADCALLMSQVNSEPRGCLAWATPIRALLAAFGEVARRLLDALGVEELGPGELDLTPGCIERARAERGEAPLA